MKIIDAQNRLVHHLAIAAFSLVVVLGMSYSGLRLGRAVGAVAFILLFLVMIIGPLVRIWPELKKIPPREFPWGIRGELGIWFTIWAIAHTLFVFSQRSWNVWGYVKGMSPWAFGAFIAVFMAIFLSAISCKKAIQFLGSESWKWIQNYFTYVIFWLTTVHVVDRALLRPGFPPQDPLYWMYLVMIGLVPLLQLVGFIKTVRENKRKEVNPEENSKKIEN